jgi:ABC-2 type transport system permease protein
LPFRYMVGFPVEVLLGQLSTPGVLTGLVYQIGWLLVAWLAFRAMWRQGVRRYAAVGG